MPDKAWKRNEREVAELFGVYRRSRGNDFSQSVGDTTPHQDFTIEIKYRKNLPKFLMEGLEQAAKYDRDKTPILVMKQRGMHGAIVSIWIEDFLEIYERSGTVKREENIS